jgi:ribosomal protein S18 acetylase RimI-like enzyme
MVDASLEIIACPPERVRDALSLVLCEIAPEARREIARIVVNDDEAPRSVAGLYIALRGNKLCAAAWGQRQPGNTAMFWPPQWNCREEPTASLQLAVAAMADLDAAGVAMSQVLLPSREANVVPVLQAVGFRHLADLLYLACEATNFPEQPPEMGQLQFEAYQASQRERMERVVERTYEDTRDCIELNGVREMGDVLDGYAVTGASGTSNWHFVRAGGEDVGVLLLAQHSGPQHWELVYMGLVPEVRGRGWGLKITRWAQWQARCGGAERMVLAVDATNLPALTMYRDAGFFAWDQRTVFARFCAARPA